MLSTLVDLPPIIGNRYEIHKVLGSGGMGTVYQAGDLLNNEFVALKQVSLNDGSIENTEDAQNDRFALTQEFKVLASLRHPNIISVLDYGFFGDDKRPYFVMEMLHGARSILDAGEGRSVRYKLNLLAQTLQALIYLHRRFLLRQRLVCLYILHGVYHDVFPLCVHQYEALKHREHSLMRVVQMTYVLI